VTIILFIHLKCYVVINAVFVDDKDNVLNNTLYFWIKRYI